MPESQYRRPSPESEQIKQSFVDLSRKEGREPDSGDEQKRKLPTFHPLAGEPREAEESGEVEQ